jgi:hypothetical protein
MNSRRLCIAAATLEVSLLSDLDFFFDVDYTFNVSTEPDSRPVASATAVVKDYL